MPAANKTDELIYGANVTYCCGIPLSGAPGAGTPEEQVRRAVNALFHEGHAGKPWLIPQAQALLRKLEEHIRSGVKVELPQPILPIGFRGRPAVTSNTNN
jgi:hypothetical protein